MTAIQSPQSPATSIIAVENALNIKWNYTTNGDQFSADDVIKAYLDGQKKGFQQQMGYLAEKFSEKMHSDLDKTNRIAAEVYATAKSLEIQPIHAFLQIEIDANNDIFCHNIVMVVSENDFIQDKMIILYEKVLHIEIENKEQYYCINFSFCPIHKDSAFVIESFISQGFIEFKSGDKK
jgi:hypothetical protein